jgi:hypothetical protein
MAKPRSTGALMAVIVVVAIQIALFQEVWMILVIPPITMALLTLNIVFMFLIFCPMRLQRRIIGLMLGGLAACFVTLLGMVPGPPGTLEQFQNAMSTWAANRADPQGPTAQLLRFLARNFFILYFGTFDILGVALIWTGGWLDHRWRSRMVRAAKAVRGEQLPSGSL